MSVFVPAVAETGIIVYRSVKQGRAATNPVPYLPLPVELADVAVFFGALSLLEGPAEPLATVIGWGIVVATLLNLWTPGGKVIGQQTAQLAPQSSTPSTASKGT